MSDQTTHTITRSIVRTTSGVSSLSAACSCGGFSHDTPRFSAPGRRKQERLMREHLQSVGAAGPVEAAAMLACLPDEAPAP